jgi:hypothetical protein
MGAGVVALTITAFVAFCGSAAGISWALSRDPYLALGVVAVVAVVLIILFFGTWWFAHTHPDQAALGGTSWLKLRQMQFEIKDQSGMPILPPSTDPLKPLAPSGTKLIAGPDSE